MKTVGHYKLFLDKKLGDGTLGRSFKAVHQYTDQPVVMRVICKNKLHESKHIKETLRSQIKYYSKITSENIANFIDIIQTTNNFYILRQFCDDGSLKDLMIKIGKVPQKQVKNILVQLMKAMFQLIKKGIIHKNFIPQNILFKKGVLKLSDFGIQKINCQIFQDKNIHTKVEYASPEIIDGAKGNFKCDIWALGIILYQMLFNEHPWPSNNLTALKNNIFKEKLKFPTEPQISKEMKKFIMSCLMIDVNERAQWSQIFESNLFQGNQIPKLNDLNGKYASILSILKSNIIASNLDVQRYFRSQNMVDHDCLSHKSFSSLIKPMAPEITDQQIQFLYVKLDKNADDQIQLKQFEEAMRQFQIPLKGSYRRKAEKLLRGKNIDNQLQEEQKKEHQLTVLYESLVYNLQKKQIFYLYDLFTESDKKRLGALQFDQFVELLRKIDKTITKGECQKIFKAFDHNQDKKIGFNEFFSNMCKITGSPNGLPS